MRVQSQVAGPGQFPLEGGDPVTGVDPCDVSEIDFIVVVREICDRVVSWPGWNP